jgi:coproporphyrinogen III oxidase-like Fe-S oxidoreductase
MPLLEQTVEAGLLTLENARARHTERGWRFLDNLIEHFLSEANPHA